MSAKGSGFARKLLLVILLAHVILGLMRIPHAVIGKRRQEMTQYREQGPVRYLLETKHHRGADEVRWILDHTPENSVVLWRGEYKGSFELVAQLIFPRLLYAEDAAGSATTVHGRPVAAKVLVGLGTDLELQDR